MFRRSPLPHVMALILIGWIGTLWAQTDLTRYAGNPILGSTESWASLWVMATSKVWIDSTYYLYYTGLTSNVSAQIGLATSPPTAIGGGSRSSARAVRFFDLPERSQSLQPLDHDRIHAAGWKRNCPGGDLDLRTQGKVGQGIGGRGATSRESSDPLRGRDEAGTEVPSGIYLYRIVAGDLHATRKMAVWR